MVRIRCPKCQSTIPVEGPARGGEVACPGCGARLRVGHGKPAAPAARLPAREVMPEAVAFPPPGALTPLWVGAGVAGVLVAVALVIVFRPRSGPEPSPGPEPIPAPVLFTPPAVIPDFPDELPPGSVIASGPGAVPVLGVNQGRGLSASRSIGAVAALPDNERCVSGSYDGTVEVWNYRTGQKERDFPVPNALVMSVAPSPDGARLAFGCRDQQFRKFVVAWDLAGGRELWRSEPVQGFYQEVAVSPDGTRVMALNADSASPAGLVRIWGLAGGELLKTLRGEKGYILRAAWHPNGRQVLLGRASAGRSEKRATVWDPETGNEVPFMGLKSKRITTELTYWAVSTSADRMLIRMGPDLLFVDPARAAVLARVRIETATYSGAAFAKDGRRAMCWGGASRGGRGVDNFVHILDGQDGREVCRLESVASFQSAAFTPDGKGVLAASRGLAFWPLPD